MSYNNSSDMSSYLYSRNYNMPTASKEKIEENRKYLMAVLPYSDHKDIDLYLDPGGNVSRNIMGQVTQDINKVLDKSRSVKK